MELDELCIVQQMMNISALLEAVQIYILTS